MEDVKTVHYVSKDPIANLKVKVVVTRISALKRKPKYAEQLTENAAKAAASLQKQVEQQLHIQQQQQLAAPGNLPMVPSIYHPAYPYPPHAGQYMGSANMAMQGLAPGLAQQQLAGHMLQQGQGPYPSPGQHAAAMPFQHGVVGQSYATAGSVPGAGAFAQGNAADALTPPQLQLGPRPLGEADEGSFGVSEQGGLLQGYHRSFQGSGGHQQQPRPDSVQPVNGLAQQQVLQHMPQVLGGRMGGMRQPGDMQSMGMEQGMVQHSMAMQQLGGMQPMNMEQFAAVQQVQQQQQQQQQQLQQLQTDMQWQQHQLWQQQHQQLSQLQQQQQQLQLDPLTGQWVSMGPLLGLLGPAPPAMSGMPHPWHAMSGLEPDGLPLPVPLGGALPMAVATPAEGAAAAATPTTNPTEAQPQAPGAPEKQTISRTFTWQEKVYSRSEVAMFQEEAMAAGGYAYGAGLNGVLDKQPQAQADLWQQQDQQQAAAAAQDDVAGIRRAKRHGALGSEHSLQQKKAAEEHQTGSVLFTYINSDEFCEREELRKTVTTSESEQKYPVYRRLMSTAKSRQQVMNFRSMYIMADLADDSAPVFANERVLVSIKAYPDGSFDMRPGFSKEGCKYRFEDSAGGIYEYSVENASLTSEPTLQKRTAKLQKAVAQRAAEVRHEALKLDFQKPPGGPEGTLRLVLLGEIMAAADFQEDQLYIEYLIQYDIQLWELQTAWAQVEPGLLRGVTHVSSMRQYPEDPATCTPARWVAHFAHPIELELTSKGLVPQGKYPNMLLQVCTYNRRNRYTCEGYGWVNLGGRHVPGSCVSYVRTWKPLGSTHDKLQEFFVGGSKELEEFSYLTGPTGPEAASGAGAGSGFAAGIGGNGRVVNNYGFKTESSGVVKLRWHSVVQKVDVKAAIGSDVSPLRMSTASAAAVLESPNTRARNRREMSLNEVVARARSRLKEARGGDVEVRPGLVSEAPVIRLDASPLTAAEGTTTQLKVVASGLEPLRYQWFKDDRKLTMATADTNTLIVTEVEVQDQGQYYCQVSNKDGSVNSAKALLKVERAGRLGLGRTTDEPRRKATAKKTRMSVSINPLGGEAEGVDGQPGGVAGGPSQEQQTPATVPPASEQIGSEASATAGQQQSTAAADTGQGAAEGQTATLVSRVAGQQVAGSAGVDDLETETLDEMPAGGAQGGQEAGSGVGGMRSSQGLPRQRSRMRNTNGDGVPS